MIGRRTGGGVLLLVAALAPDRATAADPVEALIVYPGWTAEVRSAEATGDPAARAGAEGIWLWSAEAAPRSWPVAQRPPVSLEPTGQWLEVDVGGVPPPMPPRLRLLVAPAAMWQEVPEALIPSWPVPATGRLRVPRPPAEPWRVRLAGGGFGCAWTEVEPGRRRVSLAVEPAPDRTVRIADAAGEPVAGLAVQVFGARAGDPPERIAVYRSDERGAVRLPGLPGELEVELLAIGEDRAPLRFAGRLRDLPGALRVAVGSTLEGRLVDGAGTPVTAAEVMLFAFAGPGSPRVVARRANSDGRGAWRLAGLAPGPAQLAVVAEGFARMSRVIEIEDTGKQDLGRLVIERGRTARVKVRDPEQRAVAGAEVVTGAGHRGVADSQGLVLLAGLPPDRVVTATVTAAGFVAGAVRLDPAHDGVLEVRLTPAVRVSGRLLDAQGVPVDGGLATLEIGSGITSREIRPDGSFEVEPPPQTPATLVLASDRTAALRVTLPPAEAGSALGLGDLAAPAGLTVTGRLIRFEDAAPVAGARVWTLRTPDDPVLGWSRGDWLEARSDADGRFHLTGLPLSGALVRFDAPARARRYLEVPPRDGAASQDLGEVVLERGCKVTVSLDVESSAGLQVRLDLRGAWLESDMLTASTAGDRVVFEHVPAGAATLSVVQGRELICDREIEVPAGEEELHVECREGRAVVRGTVFAGDVPAGPGRLTWSLAGWRPPAVILKRSAGDLRSDQVLWGGRPDVVVLVGAGGWFETTALRAGSWYVSWAPDSGVRHARRLEVHLAEADDQEVALRFPLLAIRGTVLDERRRAVAGARVEELTEGALALSGDDGSFLLDGLEAGALRLRARLGDASSEVVGVDLEAGRPPPAVELELVERRDAVSVEVRDAEGSPLPGALVFLEAEDGSVRLLTADSAGRVSAPFHPPLPVRLRAAAFTGNAWILGRWFDLEAALDGVSLQLGAVGVAEISCEQDCGVLGLRSEAGWDLAGLNLRLGRRLAVVSGESLTMVGLPAGRYVATVGAVQAGFTVEEGRVRELRLP